MVKRSILLLLIAFPLALKAEVPGDFSIRGSIFAAGYTPELEDKYANDKLFGSFLAGGYGTNQPWQNKNATGIPLEIEYANDPIHVELELFSILSKPSYTGFTAVSIPSLSASVFQFETTNVTTITRTTPSAIFRYDLTDKGTHEFSVFAGLRAINISAAYDYTYYQRLAVGSVSAIAIGKSFEFTSTGRANGILFGPDYRYHLTDGSEFKVRLGIYSMSGTWKQNRTTADINSGGSGSGLIRNEDGQYRVAGVEFTFGYFHALTESLRLFGQFRSQTSSIRDRQVNLFRLGLPFTSSEVNNLIVDTALTYPGSRNRERVFGLQVGAEYTL